MSSNSLFWILVGGLLASLLAAIGAKALRQFSRHDLEEACRRRDRRGLFGEILRLHEPVGKGVECLLVLLYALVGGAAFLWLDSPAVAAAPAGAIAVLLDVAILGIVLCATTLWIPWAVVRLWAEPFLIHTWRIWRLVALVMKPLVAAGHGIDMLLHRLAGRTPEFPNGESIEEEIRTIVTEGHREGLLEEDAREMIEGVIELGDAEVSEIMTPRTDMHMMHVGLAWDKMLQYVIQVGHTRIPVYDRNRDDVVGVLHVKDLLPEFAKKPDEPRSPLKEIVRPAYFVPETKAVDDLLEEFQQTRIHIAVVLDEYGGVSGLVTIEDVLEEIVGEIVDEYDEELVEEISRIDDRTCEALGRAHVDEINEQLGIALPDDGDFDTIGGFVFTELGRVPEAGESLTWQDQVRLTVLEATSRRIERLRIELLHEVEKEAEIA